MAGTKSDENDDEEFGDFTFASFPSFVQPAQTNGGTSAAAGDDVWGDFVESSVGSGFPDTQSSTHVSTTSKPPDPFGFFPDKSTTVTPPLQSTLNRTGSVPNQWVKPKGALPLSIFGEPELPEEHLEVPSSSSDKSEGQFKKDSYVLSQNQLGLNSNSSGLDANSRSDGTVFVSRSNSNLDFTFQNLAMEKESSISDFTSHGRSKSLTDMGSSFGLLPQDAQSKPASGLNLDSDLLGGNKMLSGLNYGLGGVDLKADLFASNPEFDAFTNRNGYSPSQQSKPENGFGLNAYSSNWASNPIEFKQSFDALIPNVDPTAENGDFGGDDDDGWEFKDAFSTFKVENGNEMVDKKEQTNSEVNVFSSVFGNGSNDQSIDLFSASNGFSEKIREAKGNSDLKPTTAALDGFPSVSLFRTDPITAENAPKSAQPNGNIEEFDTGDDDDDEWEFKDADIQKIGDGKDQVSKKELASSEANLFSSVSATGSNDQSIDSFSASNGFSEKAGEVDNNSFFKSPPVASNGFSPDPLFETQPATAENGPESGQKELDGSDDDDDDDDDDEWEFKDAFLDKVGDGKDQGNEKVFDNCKGALPLSIFGDEDQDNDSPKVPDGFTYKPSSLENGIRGQGLNVAIHDLITNLYSQAEKITSVDNTEHVAGSGSASDKNVDPSIVGYDDYFDGTSWEFKDASAQVGAGGQNLLYSPSYTSQSDATKLKSNNFVDFYCKLKDKLSFVCRCHLNSFKVTQNTDSFSGGDTDIAAIEEEIQAFEELHGDVVNCQEYSEDQPLRDDILSDFLEVLQEENFRVLESEYQLSSRLQLAVRDFRSAVELLNHVKSVLKVLTIGSIEDQNMYIATWSKMISVCARELKHGLRIWKQLKERNFSLLHETRGKHNIIALGEIYRVVLILQVSTKLYRPWTLSSSVDSSSIYGLIEECCLLWSNSGIEEALQGISDQLDIEYHSTVEALLESIKNVHGVEGLTKCNHVASREVSTCRLSLLGSEAVPGMKLVSWSGEYYFLTLANLWANLISCDPPKLPQLCSSA